MPDRKVRPRASDGSPKGRDRVSGLGSRQPGDRPKGRRASSQKCIISSQQDVPMDCSNSRANCRADSTMPPKVTSRRLNSFLDALPL